MPLFGYKLLKGDFYLAYELILDLFGLFFVIGLGMAVYRRFVVRPARIDPTARFAKILTLLFLINLTGFVMEACRLAVTKPWWAPWSPVGYVLGQGLLAVGLTEALLRATHLSVWLFHAVISLLFVAMLPYSYFVHLMLTPLNIFFCQAGAARRPRPHPEHRRGRRARGPGHLEAGRVLVEATARLRGVLECGRCQDACPAYLSGTALSPKQVIVKLKRHLRGELPGPIHGELIKPEELWACTTCMACVQECPSFIDIVDTIVDLRRYLTLSEGALPSTAPQSLQNIERAGNPWGLPAAERLAWAEGLDVPILEAGQEVEYLYWVGCSASYDQRNQAIARSVVRILKRAGVSFAVMAEERCHAEVGRRLGRGVSLPDPGAGQRGGHEAVPLQEGHHPLSALLQHHPQRVPPVRWGPSRWSTIRRSSRS